jgi:transposase
MHYIGVDYHKKYSYIVVEDEERNPEQRGTVANSREYIQHFLEPYRPAKAVVEATRNWGLIYDWLEGVLDDVALAHPLEVKSIAEAKIKTDKISADILANLLCAGLLPTAYAPSNQTRDLKNILRQRMFFVRVQTMVKNRVYDILDRRPEVLPKGLRCPTCSGL